MPAATAVAAAATGDQVSMMMSKANAAIVGAGR
jgi:hypothetical protein